MLGDEILVADHYCAPHSSAWPQLLPVILARIEQASLDLFHCYNGAPRLTMALST